MGRLAGRIALITGAAQGMGAAHTRLLAAEGARVVAADILDEMGAKVAASIDGAVYQHLDVTSEQSWAAAVERTRADFGRLDILVNNAGVMRYGTLEQTSAEEYEAVIRINQFGCFLGMKAVLPLLRAAGGGSIINVSSAVGLNGVFGSFAYATSKWAIRGMTKCAAVELGHEGIRVNSVHPGGVDTDTARALLGGVDDSLVFGHQPLPRIAAPEEVSRLVLFLASDDSTYCTGAEFLVDGGMTCGSVPVGLPAATDPGGPSMSHSAQ